MSWGRGKFEVFLNISGEQLKKTPKFKGMIEFLRSQLSRCRLYGPCLNQLQWFQNNSNLELASYLKIDVLLANSSGNRFYNVSEVSKRLKNVVVSIFKFCSNFMRFVIQNLAFHSSANLNYYITIYFNFHSRKLPTNLQKHFTRVLFSASDALQTNARNLINV